MFAESHPGSDSEMTLKRLKTLSYKIHEHHIEQVWKRFENAGFKPLLIKGWWAAQCYPDPAARQFSDVDLAFSTDEYPQAVQFLESLPESSSINIAIDLHEGLRHLDTVDFEILYINSQSVKCGQANIRVPRLEDHLRILCVHWLIDGGAKKEKLRDIYYAVENRPADFDWHRCLDVVSENRRRWIVCTVGLAHKYLGLDVRDTPLAGCLETVPKWLIKAVEKEWQSDTLIVPLHFVLNDWKSFWKQIKKRVPPNPIQATVEMEGSFDKNRRVFYQIGNIFQRFAPSVRRILRRRNKGK